MCTRPTTRTRGSDVLIYHPLAAAHGSAFHASDQLSPFLYLRLPLLSLEALSLKILPGSRGKFNWSCKSSSKQSASCTERTASISFG